MWQETVVCLLNLGVCTDKFATLGSESLLLLINLKKKKTTKRQFPWWKSPQGTTRNPAISVILNSRLIGRSHGKTKHHIQVV